MNSANPQLIFAALNEYCAKENGVVLLRSDSVTIIINKTTSAGFNDTDRADFGAFEKRAELAPPPQLSFLGRSAQYIQ